MSSSTASHSKGALIDRGANGGIAGNDVRIISKTDRSVDIQGIDNHRINVIPIVTAGGVTTTQKGPVIATCTNMPTLGKENLSIHVHSWRHINSQSMTNPLK